jgi:hypothetical protein
VQVKPQAAHAKSAFCWIDENLGSKKTNEINNIQRNTAK